MKRSPQTTRAEYEAIQRARTEAKWTLNGITREEVAWILQHVSLETARGPILCLGVRNGLEVDLFREAFGGEVQGVELHPNGARSDVWVGSFDAMPGEWAFRFRLLYSNALDHAYDPIATAAEWQRVAHPGAMLALSLSLDTEPSATDPIADIGLSDCYQLFPGSRMVEHRTVRDRLWLLFRLP